MASFTPPTEPFAAYNDDSSPLQKRLMRHSNGGVRGRNVYILNDNTVTETDPDGTTVTYDDVAVTFYGGHAATTVTSAQQALLEAAGYTVDP